MPPLRLLNINTLKIEDWDLIQEQLLGEYLQDPGRHEAKLSQKERKRLVKRIAIHLSAAGEYDEVLSKAKPRFDIPYICLSHVWYDRGRPIKHEVLLEDMKDQSWRQQKCKGAQKIARLCETVRDWCGTDRCIAALPKAGIEVPEGSNGQQFVSHVWIDTCCVDQQNPAEVSMSVNSMFRWYSQAVCCFVYLHDHTPKDTRRSMLSMNRCEWFQRGWTLQELIASPEVEFFSADWRPVGRKSDLYVAKRLGQITGIEVNVVLDPSEIQKSKLSLRFPWAAGRITRFEEDCAYSLLGIFNVQMSTLYGEGEDSAFRRLQEEIIKYSNDHSIFAWHNSDADPTAQVGLLAPSANCFQTFYTYRRAPQSSPRPYATTNKGLEIELFLLQDHGQTPDVWVASLDCEHDEKHVVGIYLLCISQEGNEYCRIRSNELTKVDRDWRGVSKRIFVRQITI